MTPDRGGPWAGIARLEMPSGIGRDAAVEAAERAAGWLPVFASALHRDARAPVNLTPIAGLERHLHRLQFSTRRTCAWCSNTSKRTNEPASPEHEAYARLCEQAEAECGGPR